jgi:hypothetical protein
VNLEEKQNEIIAFSMSKAVAHREADFQRLQSSMKFTDENVAAGKKLLDEFVTEIDDLLSGVIRTFVEREFSEQELDWLLLAMDNKPWPEGGFPAGTYKHMTDKLVRLHNEIFATTAITAQQVDAVCGKLIALGAVPRS